MTPRTAARRLVPLLALAALVVGAAGCGTTTVVGRTPAATVNGQEISRAQVQQRVEDYEAFVEALGRAAQKQRAANEAAGQASLTADQLQGQIDQELAPYEGGEYSIGAEGAAIQLTELIGDVLISQALEDAGGKVTSAQRKAARATIADSVEQRGSSIAKLPKRLIDSYVEFEAAQQALRLVAPQDLLDAVDEASSEYEAALRKAYDDNPESFQQVCGRLIATDDEAAGQAARDRIVAGEEFSTVANEVSTIDPAAATDTQCYALASITQVFGGDAPAAGDLLGPADNQGKWALMVVDALQTTSFDDARANLEQQFPDTYTQGAQAAIDEWVAGALRRAADEVKVDPRYGRWSQKALKVVPPAAAVLATTTTTIPVLQTVPTSGS